MSKTKTRILFRVDNDGIVYALFPDDPADYGGNHVTCYERIGGHCNANLNLCLQHSREATAEESASLAAELRRLGYDF